MNYTDLIVTCANDGAAVLGMLAGIVFWRYVADAINSR